MHASSLTAMQRFHDHYLLTTGRQSNKLIILDIGSKDVNGSYRSIFSWNPNWTYIGADITFGPNVDLKIPETCWGTAVPQADILISGQCLEHVEDLAGWAVQLRSCLKPEALVCLIAPWKFKQHRFPVDCWRILPDGMRWLLVEQAGLSICEVYIADVNTIGIGRSRI